MPKYTFIGEKREGCPKYTRGICPGQTTDDDYMVDVINKVEVKRAYDWKLDCKQEEWQKKLNGITSTPFFILQEDLNATDGI